MGPDDAPPQPDVADVTDITDALRLFMDGGCGARSAAADPRFFVVVVGSWALDG